MSVSSVGYVYILGDADRIRERIDYFLLNNRIEELTKFSQSLVNTINEMKLTAITTMNAEVIMAGGDDVLFRVDMQEYRSEHLQKLAEFFYTAMGCTISFGIGKTVESAYINLRRAKASINDKIIE